MLNDISQEATTKMGKAIESLRENLQKVRAGRAHAGILDQVEVEYYGANVPLKQAATVSLIDARTLNVKPFDPKMAPKIEKAIRESNLGLNPSASGAIIRVPMPALTEERRKDLIKVVRQEAEESRIAVRNIRRDANSSVKQLLKDKAISEDDARQAEEDIQKDTDKHIKLIDAALEQKEKDLMQV